MLRTDVAVIFSRLGAATVAASALSGHVMLCNSALPLLCKHALARIRASLCHRIDTRAEEAPQNNPHNPPTSSLPGAQPAHLSLAKNK